MYFYPPTSWGEDNFCGAPERGCPRVLYRSIRAAGALRNVRCGKSWQLAKNNGLHIPKVVLERMIL